ncbi:MAG TPA: glycosyltransferase family 4 protein [Ignavibacteria bacterium]|nr:glycosyltransferase family 4 protein [Ignavibacteria bacterium]HMR39842.1 glycosyltransferase family 4 protein [Ignavibacteria bacterium]
MIIIFQRILPHYRTGFFRKFTEKYKDSVVLYGQPHKYESLKNDDPEDDVKFKQVKNIYFTKSGSIFFSKIFGIIFRSKPDIVISVFNTGNLNIYLLFLLRKFYKFKIILWSFGYDPVRGFDPENNFSDKIRLYLSEKADGVIFYWEKGKGEVEKYAKKKDHFFVAPNTLDTEKLITLKENFDKTGKERIKSELGVKEKHHFVYIGRLLEDKQIDILIKAFSKLEGEGKDIRLTIVGDGPELKYLEKLKTELGTERIFFTGEILDEEQTGKWIYISEAFIMPGRLGLSVVHSFCFGTPVISQKKAGYFHGEGVGYIKDGINGFLLEDGNINALSEKLSEIILKPEATLLLKENAFLTAKNDCSAEKMLEGFEKAIEHAG